MKILRLLWVLLLASLALTACASKSGGEQKPPPANAAANPAGATAAPATAAAKPKMTFLGALGMLNYYANPFNLLPKKAKPPVAQQPRLVGVIKMVNLDDKYVLVDAVTQSAAPGDLLICITNQKETANLRMSPLKNPPFLIADIASGTPAVGDRVFKP